MTERIITPTGRGFLLLDSHPAGCAASVQQLWRAARGNAETALGQDGPNVLVIGSSAGYGLAATVVGIAQWGIQGVGVALERPANARRTASAGWYRTAALAEEIRAAGGRFSFVNGDAFSDVTKTNVLEHFAEHYGKIDILIYSIAAPRRTDPSTGTTYQSVIKPIGEAHRTRMLAFSEDVPVLSEIEVAPATDAETAETVMVMGGEDWSQWVREIKAHGMGSSSFTTVALSYIGSSLTSAIYRDGTIGRAKVDLEATATVLNDRLSRSGGAAYTSVNGAAVTQASTAIPGIALYISLLHGRLGEQMRTPFQQSMDLWDQLTGARPLDLDDERRIRLDRWELDKAVQADISRAWRQVGLDAGAIADQVGWFLSEVHRLYGFDVPGVDYSAECEVDVAWPVSE